MKKIIVVLLVVCAGAGGFFGYKHFFGKEKKIVYDTVPVKKGRIQVDVTATGTIQPVNVVSVGTQVSGIIEKVYVDYNTQVKKGQLIAQLETFTLLQDLNEAKAGLKDYKAKLDYAKLTAKRKRREIRLLYPMPRPLPYMWGFPPITVSINLILMRRFPI